MKTESESEPLMLHRLTSAPTPEVSKQPKPQLWLLECLALLNKPLLFEFSKIINLLMQLNMEIHKLEIYQNYGK